MPGFLIESEDFIREITNTNILTVAAGQNILFNETPVKGSQCIQHREGSGVVTLRGLTNQNRARFKVEYSGNIAVPTDETVGEIALAISVAGEPLQSTTMRVTPAAVNEYFNVGSAVYIEVPRGCCTNVSVENVSTIPILVADSNLIVTREA